MVLEFEFEYIGDNDYFLYLLKFYAKEYRYSFDKQEDKIIFQIEGSEDELNSFCENLKGMSNSVFLKKFDVRAAKNLNNLDFCIDDCEKFPYITHLNSSAYVEKKELLANEWDIFCENEFSLDGLSFEKIDKNNFCMLLEKALQRLKNKQEIYLKNHKGNYKLKLFDGEFECDFLMACDIKAIQAIFVCSNENLKLLASLEKPLIKLRLNAMFRKKYDLDLSEFKLALAQDLFSFALCYGLYNQDFHFLSVKKIEKKSKDFEVMSLDEKVVVLEGFEFINHKARELIFSKEDKNMARISYILSRFKQEAFVLELSKDYEDILLVNKELNLLQFSLPSSSQKLYEQIQEDELGTKLLSNFSKEFPLLSEDFVLKNNFYSLFCILGRILNLDENFNTAGEKLLKIADETKMPRGVKIDYRLKEDKSFDYTRTLRSAMSFMLAGVDSTNIAYGAVESLSYFLRDVYDELREKKQAEIAIVSGSLFEHKSLLKNTLKHLKDCKLSDVPLRI
ncbi:hypothetical protein [Campylobacter estrildidarum]|uniref:Protein hydE n=1 Tax=Campylobacter estrildidarum TaxID=2510189 RepID=A0A4U7BMY1_9BACT|nr:hypothetical protein [Campylobacter estrildidarum]TKX32001.1 hypothetical protein CQA69_00350 [Campylobacter estrildidarum]